MTTVTEVVSKNLDKKLTDDIFKIFVNQVFIDGYLQPEDLIDKKTLREKLAKIFSIAQLSLVVDYRETLLREASQYRLEGEALLSLLLYATFFEHTINNFISFGVRRKKLSEKTAIEIIRSASFEAKLGWLAQLLELPAIRAEHKKSVLTIANERNAFVHYKWNAQPEGAMSQREGGRIDMLLIQAGKAATYLKKYESRLMFKRHKGKLEKAIKSSKARQ